MGLQQSESFQSVARSGAAVAVVFAELRQLTAYMCGFLRRNDGAVSGEWMIRWMRVEDR